MTGEAGARGPLEVAVGEVVARASFTLTRDSLVRYAGASGDFNPIHYRDDVAASVGLPGVLAHGMLTMGIAVQPVVDWLGTRGTVVDYQVRFTRPVVVDPQTGAVVEVVATVGAVDGPAVDGPAVGGSAVAGAAAAEGIGDSAQTGARIDLTTTVNGETVLGKAQVRVSFS